MNIGIVLVTFNRLKDLEKTVRLYEQQTKLPSYIIVVDNHSTDGTGDFLKAWSEETGPVRHHLITLPENIGGSGGFHAGTKAAQELEADWIWLADDDAYPDTTALQELESFLQRHSDLAESASALCTKVYDDSGIAIGHRCRVKKNLLGAFEIPVAAAEYEKEYFSLDVYSFVGAIVKKEALLKAGLPNKDFFIYEDDVEHSLRMKKQGDILCVPACQVFHSGNSNMSREASWRDYYTTRNVLLTTKWHFGFWAYFVRIICRLLTASTSMNPERLKVFFVGIRDAHKETLGIHPVYRPGWQPKKKFKA